MALLRLLCFPSTTHLSTQQLFSPTTSLQKPPQVNNTLFPPPSLCLSASSSFSPFCHTLRIKTRRPHVFIFNVSSSTQSQPTIETPQIEQPETVEEEEDDEASRTRLLAQNIPWTCTPDDLRPLFEKYGTVLDIELSMYNKTRNRGLAFVSMSSHEEALAAFNNLESYEFEGRTMKLAWARPRTKRPPPPPPKPVPIHNLFVANLPYQARAKDLKEFFNSVSAEVIFYDNPRRSAGYGFVSFNTKEEAEAALSAFQGQIFMGRPIRVGRSKRFLRKETKLNTQSENTSAELNSSDEQSEKGDEA
ncbi:hypothetical protein F0562_035669 [Nyssa sinensis]|uniref:RRM domain-containing protein n=1 Tax=Nyssa sinensis TaxID=561372 RepID=A0A5J5ADJ4_9ASTE|nr:hypothetical protein F0562_035669 [Nyssa sinensis]